MSSKHDHKAAAPDDAARHELHDQQRSVPATSKTRHAGRSCAIVLLVCAGIFLFINGTVVWGVMQAMKWNKILGVSRGEIQRIESALESMAYDTCMDNPEMPGLNDDLFSPGKLPNTGIKSYGEFFNSRAVANYLADAKLQRRPKRDEITVKLTSEQFQRAQKMYTIAFYALLKDGRTILNDDRVHLELGIRVHRLLNKEMVGRLGTTYLEDIGNDPFGHPYQIWPGPWPEESGKCAYGGLIVFRRYGCMESSFSEEAAVKSDILDALTINGNEENAWNSSIRKYVPYGFPASTDKKIYIWSYGKNEVSGQAVYNEKGYTWECYDHDQEPRYWGGGDDINNWDAEYTWGWFYY